MDFDGSSYPKAPALPAEKTILDQVQQFQQIDSTQIAQQQAKLNQANQAMGYMTRAMSSLGPDASKEQYLAVGQNAVKMGLVPAPMLNSYVERLNAAKSPRDFYNEFVTAAATHQETINYHLGQPGTVSNGQNVTPSLSSPKPGFGVRPNGLPIQLQNAPSTETVDSNQTNPDGTPNPNYGAKILLGPTGSQIPAGATPAPDGFPGQYVPAGAGLPVAVPGSTAPIQPQRILPTQGNLTGPGKTITGVAVQDLPPANKPTGPATALPPMYSVGQTAYAQDQQTASAKMQAIKPLLQALPLMETPGFLSGPLTDQFTKVVAGLKSTGLINIADTNDPTAIRQEGVKKLYQYLSNSPAAQRSDASQLLKEAGSPNPNVQILPALIKLTKDQIALDRVEALMPNAFKGQDYQNYMKHKGTFPQSVDEKALQLDLEPDENKSKAMVDDMAKRLNSGNNKDRATAEKFFKTLRMAKDQGFY